MCTWYSKEQFRSMRATFRLSTTDLCFFYSTLFSEICKWLNNNRLFYLSINRIIRLHEIILLELSGAATDGIKISEGRTGSRSRSWLCPNNFKRYTQGCEGMVETFQNYSWIQDFEADCPEDVVCLLCLLHKIQWRCQNTKKSYAHQRETTVSSSDCLQLPPFS